MAAVKNVTTPDFGDVDVTVIEVLVKPGDQVEKESSIVTLESDKATMDLPSPYSGVVKKVDVKVGDKVKTGSQILSIETSEEEKGAQKEEKAAPEPRKLAEEKPEKTAKEPAPEKVQETAKESSVETKEAEPREVLTGTVQSDSDVHAGPGVRRMARELGVNLSMVMGSGPKQRILKEDVQSFVKSQLSQPQVSTMPMTLPAIDFSKFGPIEIQLLSRIKKLSGKNLQRNWMLIPHVTQFGEADITELEAFRNEQKTAFEKQNIKLTPLVFVMKAVVASLKKFPHFNASLDTSGEKLIIKHYYNLGVAVDTPEGLVVPVVRDVNQKGLIDLAKELAELSEKARKKMLMPQEMQGACFSISSLGGIGGTAFTPIINYPEVAILGVSRTSYKPVFQNNEFTPRLMLPLSLSYDHRVIDGADGARFITHLSNVLSDIRNLLL